MVIFMGIMLHSQFLSLIQKCEIVAMYSWNEPRQEYCLVTLGNFEEIVAFGWGVVCSSTALGVG